MTARRLRSAAALAALAAAALGGCATEPLTREEAEYPDSLVIPPDLVGEVTPPDERPEAEDPAELPVPVAETIPSRVIADGERPYLALDMRTNEAWRRAGAALDRLDFSVRSRDRDELSYTVRYDPQADEEVEQPGFFARVLGGAERVETGPRDFRIRLEREGVDLRLVVDDADGEPAPEPVATRLLTLLDRQLY